jgi:hypothetical protein
MADSAAKLQQLIQVSMDTAMVGVKDHITARIQDLQIQVGQLELQVKTLTTAIAEGAATKAKARPKKAADAAPPVAAEAGGAEAAADAPVVEAAGDGKKFPANPYIWFTAKFKSDAAFRAKHLTAANLELMKNDEVIAKKKTDAEKVGPQAKYLWNHYKAKDAAVHKELIAQCDAEREAHDKAHKPAAAAQQAKEANSPPAAHK